MASSINGSVKSYTAGANLDAYVLVKKSGSGVVAVDTPATDVPVGITVNMALSGQPVAVRLLNAGGTALLKVGAAIAVNAAVYADAAGVGGITSTNVLLGYAEEASTASGDVIEVRLNAVGAPGPQGPQGPQGEPGGA